MKTFPLRSVCRPVLLLSLLLVFALLTCACHETLPVTESSTAASESETETSSEVSESPQLPLFSAVLFENVDLPAAREELRAVNIYDTESGTLAEFCRTYEGAFPVIADTVCTETVCFACVVYSVERSKEEEANKVLYDWFPIYTEEEGFGEGSQEAPVPFVYDKNSNNENGYFWIDYEQVSSGTACPYVLLYHENGEDRPLLYEEEAKVYARIIRQNDYYAVLTLLQGTERYYVLVDRSGKTISVLDWVADISVVTPLMFDGDLLYCKTDTDEDYVYDTIGVIDLTTGEYQDLLYIGNCDYWTYFADGSGIAVYGCEEQEQNVFQYYSTSRQTLCSVSVSGLISWLEMVDGLLYGITSGDTSSAFVWDPENETLFETEAFSSSCRFAFGNRIFSALDEGTLTVYSWSAT